MLQKHIPGNDIPASSQFLVNYILKHWFEVTNKQTVFGYQISDFDENTVSSEFKDDNLRTIG